MTVLKDMDDSNVKFEALKPKYSTTSSERYSSGSTPPPILGNNSITSPEEEFQMGCLRYLDGPVGVLLGAALGTALGVVLSQSSVSLSTSAWVALPGDLFIRALKCLVVPMVFVSMSICIGDMFSLGKVSIIGFRLGCLFVLTSFVAAGEAAVVVFFFSHFFNQITTGKVQDKSIHIQCNDGSFLTAFQNNTIGCGQAVMGNTTKFFLKDVNHVFKTQEDELRKMTLSEQLIDLAKQIIPMNITKAFSEASLIGIIMFAIPFGIAIVHPLGGGYRKNIDKKNALLDCMRQLARIFQFLIDWVISFTPFAVISLIAGALSKNAMGVSLLQNVGFLILSNVVSITVHTLIVMPTIFLFFTKSNPFTYFRSIFHCLIFAFGCASSIASVPVAMRCINSTKQVSRTLTRLVVPIGATVNMDGSVIYLVSNVVFMAFTSGLQNEFGMVEWVVLIIVASIGSIGIAPVPNSGLIMLLTIWNTVTGRPVPISFSFIIASEWFVDRLVTMVNVAGDCWIARILAVLVDETFLDEQEREERNDEDFDELERDSSIISACGV